MLMLLFKSSITSSTFRVKNCRHRHICRWIIFISELGIIIFFLVEPISVDIFNSPNRNSFGFGQSNIYLPLLIPLKIKRIGKNRIRFRYGSHPQLRNQALCLLHKFNCVHVRSVCLPTKKEPLIICSIEKKKFGEIVCWCCVFTVSISLRGRRDIRQPSSQTVCMTLTVNHDN